MTEATAETISALVGRLSGATAIYRCVMVEIERRRLQLGWTMDEVCDLAGVADRYYAKAVWVDSASGRQAQWRTLEDIMATLFPDGYDLIIKPKTGPKLSAMRMRERLRHSAASVDRKLQRELMSEIGKKGGVASAQVRMGKIPRRLRKLIARKAAVIRWEKVKEAVKKQPC